MIFSTLYYKGIREVHKKRGMCPPEHRERRGENGQDGISEKNPDETPAEKSQPVRTIRITSPGCEDSRIGNISHKKRNSQNQLPGK